MPLLMFAGGIVMSVLGLCATIIVQRELYSGEPWGWPWSLMRSIYWDALWDLDHDYKWLLIIGLYMLPAGLGLVYLGYSQM